MSIVVAKLYRLGKDGDHFSKKLIAQTERTRVIIDDAYINKFNQNWKNSGRIYEIDKDATSERNDEVNEVPDDNPGKSKRGRPSKV